MRLPMTPMTPANEEKLKKVLCQAGVLRSCSAARKKIGKK